MSIPVEVTLTISTAVDNEYSTADHIQDIIASAQSVFCACDVKVVDYRVGEDHEPSVTDADHTHAS